MINVQDLLRKKNCLENVICAEDDSDTTVHFSEDQDFHSFGNSPMDDLDQRYLSPAPAGTAEERDIGESSEVEEMLTCYTLHGQTLQKCSPCDFSLSLLIFVL